MSNCDIFLKVSPRHREDFSGFPKYSHWQASIWSHFAWKRHNSGTILPFTQEKEKQGDALMSPGRRFYCRQKDPEGVTSVLPESYCIWKLTPVSFLQDQRKWPESWVGPKTASNQAMKHTEVNCQPRAKHSSDCFKIHPKPHCHEIGSKT